VENTEKMTSEETQEQSLSEQQLAEVSGGLNPQPLPPGYFRL
jgi:hypothetical protein